MLAQQSTQIYSEMVTFFHMFTYQHGYARGIYQLSIRMYLRQLVHLTQYKNRFIYSELDWIKLTKNALIPESVASIVVHRKWFTSVSLIPLFESIQVSDFIHTLHTSIIFVQFKTFQEIYCSECRLCTNEHLSTNYQLSWNFQFELVDAYYFEWNRVRKNEIRCPTFDRTFFPIPILTEL